MKYSYRDPVTGRFCKKPEMKAEDKKEEKPKFSYKQPNEKIHVYHVNLGKLLRKTVKFCNYLIDDLDRIQRAAR